VPGPIDQFGKAIGNSGIYLRFRYPHTKWPDVNAQEPKAQGNAAWVAAVTGFEVQIDEQGKDDFADMHRTGAIYNVPTGPQGDQAFTAGPVLQAGKWYELEIEVVGDTYQVGLGEVGPGAAVYQSIASFTKPPGKYQGRGLAPTADNSSGYIGVQAHTGKVAFRHMRIRKL
jgi:hypothetical protein